MCLYSSTSNPSPREAAVRILSTRANGSLVDGGGSALPGHEGFRSAAIGNKAARRGQAAMQSDCERQEDSLKQKGTQADRVSSGREPREGLALGSC